MKVSIIIAIYKVSQYLRQCLDSVTGQTYRDLEIICVVGKTDEPSMQITKEYADRDERIKLIPVVPEGVAAARNAGLRAVTGELIAFVDGDDYIETDMIETMVNALTETDADISIVSKYYLYENVIEGNGPGAISGGQGNAADDKMTDGQSDVAGRQVEISRNAKIVYDKKGVMKEILKNENFFLHLWDKLYRKEIFDGVTFKEGAIVEDRQVCFNLLNKAEKFVFTPIAKYYFRQALDSSSKVYKNVADSVGEDFIICDRILKMYPDLKDEVELFLVIEHMSLIQNSFLYGVYSKEHDRATIDYIRKHMSAAMKCDRASKSLKVKMILSAYVTGYFGKITVKRRNEFLSTHKHFRSGNDWEKLFKEQGLEI